MKTLSLKNHVVLIANRGEIAIRVARTARKLGMKSVAVYSDADRFSEHVKACDFAYAIGGNEPSESYLRVEKILEAAKATGATLIHPGYGFLSERPHFVKAVEAAGIGFVGPTAESMEVMGDKIAARNTVSKLRMPGVPGSPGAVKSLDEVIQFSRQVKFPVLLKAAAGGGGKGMRRVDREEDLKDAFESASREALQAFGDGSMYVEKYILEPHHVEVQVFGDGQGGAVHLGERECSIQRRHQKVWEESPSPILETHPATRQNMYDAAVAVSREIQYRGAGTFEFIVDGAGDFYFLEMNTRLQVEHPVTEWVTGVDLVEWQLRLAAGEFQLPAQSTIQSRGSSIEVRLYAEDPENFLPAPGKIGLIREPNGPFLRWDSSYVGSGEVSRFYDPMIAKLSVWGRDREEAIGRTRAALDELSIEAPKRPDFELQGSLKTNLQFLRNLARCADVIEGNTTTDLIPKNPKLTERKPTDGSDWVDADWIAFALCRATESQADSKEGSECLQGSSGSVWKTISRREGVRS